MKLPFLVLLAIVIGIILGFVCTRFFNSPLDLIPWAIVGLLFGFWSNNKKQALLLGGIYGFILSFSFMAAGYQGSAPILSRIPFFVILGIFGGICGLILAFIGNVLRKVQK